MRISLDQWTRKEKPGRDLELYLTVKSFDLQAIRERYLKSRASGESKKTGSVERRAPGLGGLIKAEIIQGKFNYEILDKFPEPRGVAKTKDLLAVSSENKVMVHEGEKVTEITNPWFSFIHTVDFHPQDDSRILISSSGFDALFEYNWRTKEVLREWFAWEHGFQWGTEPETGDKIALTRKREQANAWAKEGVKHRLISPEEKGVLPTAMRAAFINSALYDTLNPGHWLATYFHEGAVYRISEEGKPEKIIEGLKNPHGGRRMGHSFLVTSTGHGLVRIKGEEGELEVEFSSLPGKDPRLGEMEWLQNSAPISSNEIITIDSNRNALVWLNLEEETYCLISYPDNWAVQDLVVR